MLSILALEPLAADNRISVTESRQHDRCVGCDSGRWPVRLVPGLRDGSHVRLFFSALHAAQSLSLYRGRLDQDSLLA